MVMERSVMSCDQWETPVKGDFVDLSDVVQKNLWVVSSDVVIG